MNLFGREYRQSIIIDREDLTSKYGLRFVNIGDSDWGTGTSFEQSVDTTDSLNDIPLVEKVNKSCLSIDMTMMCFNDYGNPRPLTDVFIREMSRKFAGTKEVRELRIGDYLYFGWFIKLERVYMTSTVGYLKATFQLASPNCYTIRLIEELGVENSERTTTISNRSTGSEYLYPDIIINTQSPCSTISILNSNDNSTFEMFDVESNARIHFVGDGINQFEDKNRDGGKDYFSNWNRTPLRLVYGINTIVLKSDGKCSINIVFQNELSLF